MMYYAIHVLGGKAAAFNERAQKVLESTGSRIHWPRRTLNIRKQGKTSAETSPIYPGYLFVECPGDNLPPDVFRSLRSINGFIRFLRDNLHPTPLTGADLECFIRLIATGSVVGTSRVIFDENNRIKVISGPLSGLEGHIVKVDKRKGRAKVRLSVYDENFLVDFGFEAIEGVSAPTETGGTAHEQ